MNNSTNLTSTILVFLVLIAASAIAAYWKERNEGYSHTASARTSSILLAILLCNATINYAINIADL